MTFLNAFEKFALNSRFLGVTAFVNPVISVQWKLVQLKSIKERIAIKLNASHKHKFQMANAKCRIRQMDWKSAWLSPQIVACESKGLQLAPSSGWNFRRLDCSRNKNIVERSAIAKTKPQQTFCHQKKKKNNLHGKQANMFQPRALD